jgi:hypothetical protein
MKNVLLTTGITTEMADEILAKLAELGVENANDLAVLTDKDITVGIATVSGMNTVISRKVLAVLKKAASDAITYTPSFAEIPADLKSPIDIKVTANVTADTKTLIQWINIINLYNIGIEDIAKGLKVLVDRRFENLEVGATPKHLEMYATVNKFTAIDDSLGQALLEKLNIRQSLADSRIAIIEAGNDSFLPDLVTFINRALDLGVDTQSISMETVRRILGVPKVGNNINLEDLTMAANQFIAECNKNLRGLNTLVIQETYALYHELFALIDSDELQKFLGVSNKEELLREIGVSVTPRQARTYAALPQCIFTLVDAVKNHELQDNEKLYIYLQTAWSALRNLDLMGVVPVEARRGYPSVGINI